MMVPEATHSCRIREIYCGTTNLPDAPKTGYATGQNDRLTKAEMRGK